MRRGETEWRHANAPPKLHATWPNPAMDNVTHKQIHFHLEQTMNIIIWLIVGGVIGWLASLLMKTDGQQGIILNVVVGIVGAVIGGWFISPLVGAGTINQDNFSLPALVVSFVGAAILLGVVNLVRRGSVR